MKRCCITGHRPEKLGGYDWDSQRNQNIMRKLRATYIYLIEVEGVTEFMFGGALGTDQMAYAVCKKLKDEKYPNIKLLLAIPFKNQYVK